MVHLLTFDPSTAHSIDRFGSHGALITRLAHVTGETYLHCIYLEPSGLVGHHPATARQLFAVIQGAGWVRSGGQPVAITAGQAVLWQAGEWHESGTETGMTVLIVEGEFDCSAS